MTQRILGPEGSKRRKRFWLVPIVMAALAVVFYVTAAQAVLPGSPSKFESGNDPTTGLGNMVVDTSGDTDWVSVTSFGAYTHIADAAASNSDDSFTPGQKQDTTCPTVEGHKNPPKDDFSDIASYTETSGAGETYLYGATIRVAANGSASENIELKQGTSGLCAGSTTLLARTAGDKLLAIDYTGGGSAVAFHVLTWITSGACNVANDPAPCWGATVLTLNPAVAEGGVNTAAISAADNPISGVALVAGQFAEFGINLAAANILPAGTCSAFAQTVWESRSSGSSFVSSTKDVSIETKTISNCGEIKIIKHSNPRGVNQAFAFTSTIPATATCVQDATPAGFSLNDSGNTSSDNAANTEDCTSVPSGSYTVTEGANPANFVFGSVSCVASGTGTSQSTSGKVASITLAGGGLVTCTYVNNQQFGAIKILKESTKTGNPLVANAGAVFGYDNGAGSSGSVTDDATAAAPDEDATVGSVCVSGLIAGTTYTVTETTPPSGYGAASGTQTAVATAGTNCGANLPTGTGVATFTNPPLADIQVNFKDGGSGETSLDVPLACTHATGTESTTTATGWDNSLTVTGVQAGATVVTITCTIKIDP